MLTKLSLFPALLFLGTYTWLTKSFSAILSKINKVSHPSHQKIKKVSHLWPIKKHRDSIAYSNGCTTTNPDRLPIKKQMYYVGYIILWEKILPQLFKICIRKARTNSEILNLRIAEAWEVEQKFKSMTKLCSTSTFCETVLFNCVCLNVKITNWWDIQNRVNK